MSDLAAVRDVLACLQIDVPGLHSIGEMRLFRADPDQLLPLWRRLHAAHEHSGLWPLILGTDDDIAELGTDFGWDPEAEVARGLAMDATARLAQLRASLLSEAEDDDEACRPQIPPRGETSGLRPHDEDAFVLAEKPGWLGLVQADTSYVVPGKLTWDGAVNYAMEPADHVAVLKHWHDLYGAELVGPGLDTIELWVPHPPTRPAAAAAIAEEQYWYCPDIIDQGVRTLDGLAAIQVPARRWFFWWD